MQCVLTPLCIESYSSVACLIEKTALTDDSIQFHAAAVGLRCAQWINTSNEPVTFCAAYNALTMSARVFTFGSLLSSVCNVRAPYSGGWNFRQYFFAVLYLSHPLTSVQYFTEIVQGNSSVGGVKRKRSGRAMSLSGISSPGECLVLKHKRWS